MKKMILIAAVAAVTMTGCSMNEVEIESGADAEMQFSPNTISSKALINPDANATDRTVFPATESFGVIAIRTFMDNGVETEATFMDKVEISNTSPEDGLGDWKAKSGTYLWPLTGTIDFYAYHPYKIVNEVTADEVVINASVTDGDLSLIGINLGKDIGKQIDPLVAVTETQIALNKPKVGLVFKHIASQIVITAKDVTETAGLQGKITLKKVMVNGVEISGDYLDGSTSGKGTWSNQGTPTDFEVFDGEELLPAGENDEFYLHYDETNLYEKAFVVVPQSLDETKTITVIYDVAAFTWNGIDYEEQKDIEIPARIISSDENDVATLVRGKRYFYHLGFSLDGANREVLFSPEVEGWETEDINGIVIDCTPEEPQQP